MAFDPKKKGGLGRGLNAILSDDVKEKGIESKGIPLGSISFIPLVEIEVNPFQPRTEFDVEALEELAASIRVHGIIQPITVRKLADHQFQVISGERRLRASKLAGLVDVPAYIRTADDEQMIEMALIENIQRQDLNPIEVALSYKRMIEEIGLKQDELGDKVGKSRATITNSLRLLKLPAEIQVALRDGRLSMGHAKPMINIENPMQQISLLNEILEEGLNVRQTEERARKILTPSKTGKKIPAPIVPKEVPVNEILLHDLEDKLENKFGNKVTLTQDTTGRGEIRIAFLSTDDLNRMIELLDI